MIQIITAINDEKINSELKQDGRIHVVGPDISYREGILETLEKTKNIQYVLIKENLYGQIKIEELLKQIKEKNKMIKIIMILKQKEEEKEKYLTQNKIQYIYQEEVSYNKILEKIFPKNTIFLITGNPGSGKTITTLILGELISLKEKVLIVEDNIKTTPIIELYEKENNNKITKIKQNLFVLNIKNFTINYKKNQNQIIEEINKIKNNYQYILIDSQNLASLKIYQKLSCQILLLLEANMLEIHKIKNFLCFPYPIKTILNKNSEQAISEKIIEAIFKNKIRIISKIKYNKNYCNFINNGMNLKYLDKETKNKFLNIIKKL